MRSKLKNESILLLDCTTEKLSQAQLDSRKKRLDDISALRVALTNVNTSSKVKFINQNGNVNGTSFKQSEPAKPKQNRNNIVPNILGPAAKLTQSLRGTRKALVNSATPSPPPVIRPAITKPTPVAPADTEDEIEVIQDTRPTIKQGNSMRPIVQSAGNSTKPQKLPYQPPKSVPKPNNLLLLNINVRPRNLAAVNINSVKRKELDTKVKVVLMKSPSEFVEWLLRMGLIRSQQYCNVHKTVGRQPNKLKLGMFSDPKVLATSGGYVWLGDCCGRKYISVYSGSIFGSTPIDKIPPSSILKLIYHWSCQTTIANVESWVKAPKIYISRMYNYFRCICSVILHDKVYDFGFDNTCVEVGIVSLGTTTTDGARKAVKVEILGLLDRRTNSYRMFASTPEPANNSRERFLRILKPVLEVAHKNARIICDQSIDPTCLHAMGYSDVEVCYSSENESDPSTNSVIMYYLRKHVPRIFQASLSTLTEHQIQLSLDELSWREKFGTTSADTYSNILDNIAYLTGREIENPGLLPLLEFVADVPHHNFRYKSKMESQVEPSHPIMLNPSATPLRVSATQYDSGDKCLIMSNKVMTTKQNGQNPTPFIMPKVQTPKIHTIQPNKLQPTKVAIPKVAPNSPVQKIVEFVDVEPYFYGRIIGNPSLGQEYNEYVFKCHLCGDTFDQNLEFYSHLKAHFHNLSTDKDSLERTCPYCSVAAFFDQSCLDRHKAEVHHMTDPNQMWCRICCQMFQSETLLKSHMMRKHVEAELPYRCEVCHFSTSFYYEIIDHFNEKHGNTPYVQCHLCLIVKTITPNGASSFSQRMFQHLQKHSSRLTCKSCVLSFYSNYLLNEHRKEHLSCANVNDVMKYEPPQGYRVLQFKPNIRSMPVVSAGSVKTGRAALSSTEEHYKDLELSLTETELDYTCIECETSFKSEAHFNQYRKCTKCTYASSCQNMMVKHHQVFHPSSKKPLPYVLGKPVALSEPLYCKCGFNTNSGHHMAGHMQGCTVSNGTAYNTSDYMAAAGNTSPKRPRYEENDFDDEEPMEIDESSTGDFLMPLSVEIEEDE